MTTTTDPHGDVRPMFIGGEWRHATGEGVMPTFNPATEKQMAEVAAGTAPDVDLAVDAARRAAPQWGGRPWTERANILRQMATRIREKVHRSESIRYLTPDPVIEYICRNRLYGP